ncbi:unnamed protein product [Ectocarpus sp. 6 AP-2014]|nr:unnamed protein product [Ectocarpus sp. CCAP 1310/34]
MSEPDDLFTLRNHFWLGSYQLAIAEGSGLGRLPEALRVERDEFIYRSYLALGQFSIVLGEIKDDAPPALQAVRLMAQYLSNPESREIVIETLKMWLTDPGSCNNPTVQLLAAAVFTHEGDLKEAVRSIRNGVTMEQTAMLAQIYLRMDRVDLALKQVQVLQQADDDATLTQLVVAWVHLAQGGKRYQEAAYIFDELIDKYQASPLLLNSSAVAKMHMGEYQEAETILVEAISKSQNDADTLVNLICVCRHLDKPASFVDRYINQLKTAHPQHPYVQSLANAESAFDRVAATFAVA